jgi:hypothetical protein
MSPMCLFIAFEPALPYGVTREQIAVRHPLGERTRTSSVTAKRDCWIDPSGPSSG